MSRERLLPSDDAKWIANALESAIEDAFALDSDYHQHRWQPGPLVVGAIGEDPVIRIVLVCPCGKLQLKAVPK